MEFGNMELDLCPASFFHQCHCIGILKEGDKVPTSLHSRWILIVSVDMDGLCGAVERGYAHWQRYLPSFLPVILVSVINLTPSADSGTEMRW